MADQKLTALGAISNPIGADEMYIVDDVAGTPLEKSITLTALAAALAKLLTVEHQVAVSDETTDLTTGTAKITFRMPFAMTVTEVRSSSVTAATGAKLTVDINEAGTTILSTKLTIDDGEKTSTTATVPPVISDAALADDAEMTIDIDVIGSTVAGKGLKVTLIGTRT